MPSVNWNEVEEQLNEKAATYLNVSFAGYSFCADTPNNDVLEWINKNIPFDDMRGPNGARNRPGRLSSLAFPLWPEIPKGLSINCFYYPSWGLQRWSVFHGLMTTEQVDTIKASAPSGSTYDFQISDGQSFNISTPMLMLPPRPLADFGADGTNQIYLITLVDDRYRLQYTNTLESEEFVPGQWAITMRKLAQAARIDLAIDAIPSAYKSASPESDLIGMKLGANVAMMLDACASSVGGRIMRPFSGGYRMIRSEKASELINLNLQSKTGIAGGAALKTTNSGTVIPQKVTVLFPRWIAAGNECPGEYEQRDSVWTHQRSALSYGRVWKEGYGPSEVGVSGLEKFAVCTNTTKMVHSSMKACYLFPDADYPEEFCARLGSGDIEPDNRITLQNLAKAYAADFYRWRCYCGTGVDQVFPCMTLIKPDACLDTLYEFGNGVCRTRVLGPPPNDEIEEQHSFAKCGDNGDSSSSYYLPPPYGSSSSGSSEYGSSSGGSGGGSSDYGSSGGSSGGSGGSSTVPPLGGCCTNMIKLGMTTTNTPWTETQKVAWYFGETKDTSAGQLFELVDEALDTKLRIKQSGWYRLSYHLNAQASITHTDSMIESMTTNISQVGGGVIGGSTSSFSQIYKPAAVSTGLSMGVMYVGAQAETVVYVSAANTDFELNIIASPLTIGFLPVANGCTFCAMYLNS